jgi:hypothetical protein
MEVVALSIEAVNPGGFNTLLYHFFAGLLVDANNGLQAQFHH